MYIFLVYKKIGCYNQGSVAKNMRGWTLPCALLEFRHGRVAVGSIRNVFGELQAWLVSSGLLCK